MVRTSQGRRLNARGQRAFRHAYLRRESTPSPSLFVASSSELCLLSIFQVLLGMQRCISCVYAAWLRNPMLQRYGSQL